MVSKTVDKFKLTLAFLVLVAGIYCFYYFSNLHLVLRALLVLGAAVLSGFVAYLSETGREWFEFLLKSRKELRQVVWPTKKEVIQTTIMITIVVFIVGLFLWLVDKFYFWFINLLIS